VVIDKMTSYALWGDRGREEPALAVMVGAMSIGIGIIIAAAVH
jgi:hypothetical protein